MYACVSHSKSYNEISKSNLLFTIKIFKIDQYYFCRCLHFDKDNSQSVNFSFLIKTLILKPIAHPDTKALTPQ